MKHHARFTTEDGERVYVGNDIEVVNHVTGEFIAAELATPEEAVLLLPRLGLYKEAKLALRDKQDYQAAVKRVG